MTDENFELSRRKILAGLGAIGAASAGAGLGTSAYFSDEENFANNSLVAGSLDLKVDWEEHYSDWSDDEAEEIGTVSMEPGDGLTGFPSTAPEEEKSVYVSDPQQFMANTAIEAFPDVVDEENPDGISAGDYDGRAEPIDDAICDFPADLDGVLSHPFRTGANVEGGVEIGGDPNPQTTAPGDPLINISDVKPGDFGEVTFSFHVCGNPAYVWLTGELVDASENGVTEPEMEDPDEDYPDGDTVELLDQIRAAVWYDTGDDGVYGATLDDKDAGEGDNIFGTGETLVPLNGSLRSVLAALEDGMFPLDAEPVSNGGGGGGGAGGGEGGVGEIVGPGSATDFVEQDDIYVTTDDTEFVDSDKPGAGSARNYNCADYEDLLNVGDIVGTAIENGEIGKDDDEDGEVDEEDEPDPIQVGDTFSGCTTITVTSLDGQTGTVGLSTTGPVKVVSVKGGPNGEQVYVFDDPVILNDVTFSTPGNYGISNIDVCCPVDGNGDNGDNGEVPGQEDGRQCFPNSTTAYVGFEWWLPIDHGNEVQTDSVSFDLGFYTEQCRHNDGSGMTPENGDDGEGGGQEDGADIVVDGSKAISWLALCCGSDPGPLEDYITCVTLDATGEVDAVGLSGVGDECDVYYKTGDGIFTAKDGSFDPQVTLSDNNFCGAPGQGAGDDEGIGTKIEGGDIASLKDAENLPDCGG